MDLASDFEYNPNLSPPPPGPLPPQSVDLGFLAPLAGRWVGEGFNAIWRPNQLTTGQDRFLALNLTTETLEFAAISGSIPNRGLLQPDLFMMGLHYLQQIADKNAPPPNGLHIEPGVWLNIPATTDPAVSATVARLGSVPHGTTLLAQGIATQASGGPQIPPVNLNPFPIGNPSAANPFPEQNLLTATQFRTPLPDAANIGQEMVDDPNSILSSAIESEVIAQTITLQVSTTDTPVLGGGTDATAFLVGGSDGANASPILVTATFWIEQLEGDADFSQLQYSQTVILNFNNLSWPHVSVATLKKQTS